MKEEGFILKGISGFYYVKTGGGLVECRARGIFRKEGISPLAGDEVTIETGADGAVVTEIKPRRNFLARPPVANVDLLVLVSSMAEPEPNARILDRMTAMARQKRIETALVFTKTDLSPGGAFAEVYRQAGFRTFEVSNVSGNGVPEVRELLRGRVSVFAGNSGVGKSSLLNRIEPGLGLRTAEISRKLGRGRHTTRQVELHELEGGGYVADTPGFSSLETEKGYFISRDDLPYAFREFEPFLGKCRYAGCTHVGEKDCAVMEAVRNGQIPRQRYESYVEMFQEVKNIKEWERKNAEP